MAIQTQLPGSECPHQHPLAFYTTLLLEKHFSGSGVPGAGAELGVDGGVLDQSWGEIASIHW